MTIPRKKIVVGFGKEGHPREVPLEVFDEELVGPNNHEPNAEGQEVLSPWNQTAGGISEDSLRWTDLRPLEDNPDLDNWPEA